MDHNRYYLILLRRPGMRLFGILEMSGGSRETQCRQGVAGE